MEQNKRYEAPKMEVIEVDTFSIVCASSESDSQEDQVNFNGTGMSFTRGNGSW